MNILGISCFYHDGAAALLKDGKVLAAALEERFTRNKHDFSFPLNAIHFCLTQGAIRPEDLDYIVFYDKPFVKFERILLSALATFPKSYKSFMEAMPMWLKQKLWVKHIVHKELSTDCPVLFTEHHESHAASAFYCSPFKRAAVLTVDGVGEWTTASYGLGDEKQLHLYREIRFPHSLGLFYSALTYYLGFRVNDGEYKVMGLAPYGQPRFLDKMKELVHFLPDGSFRLNMKYFAFHYGLTMTNQKFHDLFGQPPRQPEFAERLPGQKGAKGEQPLTQFHKDIAASGQKLLEEILLKMVDHLHRETGEDYLCMAGGVALNCVANGKILKQSRFKDLWVQPASSDAGGALGAALFAYHQILQGNNRAPLEHVYLGSAFSNSEIRSYLERHRIPFEAMDREALLQYTAKALAEGKIVAWFQEGAEFGPRALGNRSILADPRRSDMKDILNYKVKHREPFRPFAPAVLEEKAAEYFDLDRPSPYMLLTVEVRKPEAIPAVTHVDGSARVQTVNRRQNPLFYDLLKYFDNLTGCPVLLNTSFNVRGEPIVDNPHDGYLCFRSTQIDLLVLGSFVITDRTRPHLEPFKKMTNPFKRSTINGNTKESQ